ncbi:hypothetical protein BC826DRAFT_1073573, partial [Russula brevipes]
TTSPCDPFIRTIWSGSCDAGQRSSGRLLDSSRHGQVRLCLTTPLHSTDPHARAKKRIYVPSTTTL